MKNINNLGSEFKYFFEYVRTDEIHPSKIEKMNPNMKILSVFAENIQVKLNF